jgi:NADH:ubiquinone oxidoreductase subunit 6 (subunit J)
MLDLWPIVLPAALGCLAVYLLLPRPRPFPTILGAGVGTAALLLAANFLVRFKVIGVEPLLFFVFAGIALTSGVILLSKRNPVHAALSFVLVVLATCGMFLLQAAPFLMAATMIVYAGAIVVTFLFVVMLAQQSGWSDADQRSREPFLASVAGFVLLSALLFVLHSTYQPRDTTALDALLTLLERAAAKETVAEINAVLKEGDVGQGRETKPFLARIEEELTAALQPSDRRRFAGELTDRILAVKRSRQMEDAPALRDHLAALHEFSATLVRHYVRDRMTTLPPRFDAASSPLSPLSGTRADLPPEHRPLDATGHARMEAENTAYLGRALFTDFLVAVELAGALLLVATVGAITISARPAETVR